jgi:predicted RNase H-like nuclease (RuvC/YqgF family)
MQKTTLLTSRAENSSHENWTEDPTLQSLQRENAELVSAYSQAQSRMADLDKLVQTSGLEIGKLLKERQGLKAKVDALEAEVDELQASIEVAQQHTVAKDAQYSQILELSTRLQSQAEFGGQQRKIDKERWELEKHDMLQTITALRSELRTLRTTYGSVPQPEQGYAIREASGPKGTLSGVVTAASAPTSPMHLETEVVILRKANSAMKDTLSKVRQEHVQLHEYVERLGGLGRDIQRQLQAGTTGESISSTLDEERRGVWQDRMMDDR